MENNELIEKIDRFIKGTGLPTNGWFYHCPEQEVYLRRNKKIIGSDLFNFIVIANISTEEKNQKKGHFKRFLNHLESLELNIYVENVHNPNLAEFLPKVGFQLLVQEGSDDCYYKFSNSKL